MSNQNLSVLSDIPEEKSASLSVDSLEKSDELISQSQEENSAVNALNCTHDSNYESPSFHDVLSSSHCDVASNSKPVPIACVAETFHSFNTVDLFSREDAPHLQQTSYIVQRKDEISEVKTEESKHKERDFRNCSRSLVPTIANKDNTTSNTSYLVSKTTSKPELYGSRRKTAGDNRCRIPVAVRSSPVIDRLRQSIENHATILHTERSASPHADVGDSSSTTAAKTPKSAERCRSLHTIEGPKKNFVELNKQGEFRRTRTYHSLHIERRDGKKGDDCSTIAHSTPSTVASKTAAPTDSLRKGDACEDDPQQALPDPSPRSGGATAPGSSHRDSSTSTPVAVSEGSSGKRVSRIPVRCGPTGTPRRRHQSQGCPRTHGDHVSRHDGQDCPVFRRELSESGLEFHESRLSYDSSEIELVVPRLRLPFSQLSLIDVNDNRRLLCDVSAPCLLDHGHPDPGLHQLGAAADGNVSSLSLQLNGPRKVFTPPDRIPRPRRHVAYQPNLKPYPRQYINLGRLGPDPDTVRARHEKMQKQQEYAEQVAKANRNAVKQKSHQYSKHQREQTQSSHDKMVSYARTVPKPKQKPKQEPTTSPTESRKVSPMSKIRRLLGQSSLPCNQDTSGIVAARSHSMSPARQPQSLTSKRIDVPPIENVTCTKPKAAGKPAVEQLGFRKSESRPPPLPLPTFEAPKTSALPPKDNRRRPRRTPGRSVSVGQPRSWTNSLSRLRSLTNQLVTRPSESHSADSSARSLQMEGSSSTLGASKDVEGDLSTDSLIIASRPTVVSMGRGHGSTSPRGRGLFPPPRDAPSCRRPTIRCSRGVGPDRPGSTSRFVAEDCFYDTCGGHGECTCGNDSCSPPLSPHRRPVVTRGTQLTPRLNETFVVQTNALVVDIGMPVGASRARRFSPRPRLGDLSPDSLAGSPPKDGRMSRPDILPSNAATLQMMRERHLRDKRRVDAIISGSITRM